MREAGQTISLILIALVFSAITLLADNNGAPAGASGAPGEDTCTACHIGSSGTGRLSIDFNGGAATYVPGQKVRTKVTVDDAAALRWGFQLTARFDSDPKTKAGTLATVDTNTRIVRSGNLEWITHTLSGTRAGASGPTTFEFDWTAPDTDAGAVVFYAAGNGANNDNRNSGDHIYTTSLKVTTASATPVPPTADTRPSFSAAAVAETYTSQAGVAPGAWVTISGSNFSSAEAASLPASGTAYPTTLGGVQVKINNVPAALQSVSASKITLLVPASTPVGDVSLVVERDGQMSDTVVIKGGAALPAIYSVALPGSDQMAALVTPANAGVSMSLVTPKGWMLGKTTADSRAARGVYPGEEIDIWAIGLGKTDTDFPTDRPFSGSYPVSVLPKVQFGETVVDAAAASLVGPGLYAVRVKVPDSLPAGDVKLTIDSGGVTSSSKVLLTIQSQQ